MIAAQEALRIVLANARPLKAARQPLHKARGCCLAEDILADRDQPPTDRSAMDGYAVRSADVTRCPRVLRLVGEVAAGSAERPKVSAGTYARILTGGCIPPGADAVVKVEDTQDGDGCVSFLSTIPRGANIRRKGEEVRKGQVVLSKGTLLEAAQTGLCATVGKAALKVHQRPDLIIFCTGRELRPAGESVRAHQLRDANGPALRAALADHGFADVAHHIVPDDPKVLARKLKQALPKHNVVLLTGGVSVGKYDYVPQAVRAIGATVRFHGVAMKPGKPQLYATVRGNRHIFALPGNPLSVLTGFYELVLPALRRLSGLAMESCQPTLRLPLAAPVRVKPGRANFVLARLVASRDGLKVRPLTSHGSADLVAGAQADGVIVVARGVPHVPVGALVAFRPWRPIR